MQSNRWVSAVCSMLAILIVSQPAAQERLKPAGELRKSAASGVDLYDSLNGDDAAQSEAVEQLLMSQKIRTAEMAVNAAYGLSGLRMRANERMEVSDLFRVSIAVPGFAEAGDYLWRVRFVSNEPAVPRGVSGEFLVNSRSGEACDVLAALQRTDAVGR